MVTIGSLVMRSRAPTYPTPSPPPSPPRPTASSWASLQPAPGDPRGGARRRHPGLRCGGRGAFLAAADVEARYRPGPRAPRAGRARVSLVFGTRASACRSSLVTISRRAGARGRRGAEVGEEILLGHAAQIVVLEIDADPSQQKSAKWIGRSEIPNPTKRALPPKWRSSGSRSMSCPENHWSG